MKNQFLKPWLLFLFLFTACSHDSHLETTNLESLALRKIGVGDNRLSLLNAIILNPDAGVDATILQTTHNYAAGKMVRFQPSTGATEYLDLPHSSGAWGGVRIADDVYIGGHMPGDFYHLKTDDSHITYLPLPRPNGEKFDFVWSVDAGSDGNLYLGTYPDCMLLRYDPQQGTFENLDVMQDGEHYIRHVNGKFEGKIFCGVGSHAQLVEYNLATGQKTSFLPQKYQHRSFVYYSDRFQNMLYAVVTPDPVILFFNPYTHELLREVPLPNDTHDIHLSNYESVVDYGDGLYFSTRPDDDLYRYHYQSNVSRLVAKGIGGPCGVTQNRYLFCRNYFGVYSIYNLEEDEVITERPTKFGGAGMEIFALAEGVNGTVVGGSYINQGFFSYNPQKDTLISYGASVRFGGQIRQIVAFKDKLYLAHYTHARLTEYDPQKPWNPGNEADSNPLFIGAVGYEQDRFPAAYAAEDDILYFGTQPEYGVLGGALVLFQPETRKIEVYRNVVADQSIYALTGNGKGLLFGGTAIAGGLGAHPTAKEAKIFVWDMIRKKCIKERSVIPNAAEIWALQWIPDNKLIGSADSTLFVYDIDGDQVNATRTVESGTIMNIIVSRDGWCYGNTKETLFRFSPDLRQFEEIDHRAMAPQFGRGLIETRDGKIYVGIGAVLYELVRLN